LLRQFLTESQKTVIKSEFTDDSTASGIYQDFITNQLADSLSRGGGIGVAKSFQRQLSHPAASRRRTGCGFAQTHIPPRARRKMSLTMGQAGNNVQPMKPIAPHPAVEELG
jgi:Rod binding domain-containing protein